MERAEEGKCAVRCCVNAAYAQSKVIYLPTKVCPPQATTSGRSHGHTLAYTMYMYTQATALARRQVLSSKSSAMLISVGDVGLG